MLKGDVPGLIRFEARREKVLSRLPSIAKPALEANRALVDAVRASARRNASLLQAFLEGARMAEQRVRAIMRAHEELGAYRSDGSRIEPEPRERMTSLRW